MNQAEHAYNGTGSAFFYFLQRQLYSESFRWIRPLSEQTQYEHDARGVRQVELWGRAVENEIQ